MGLGRASGTKSTFRHCIHCIDYVLSNTLYIYTYPIHYMYIHYGKTIEHIQYIHYSMLSKYKNIYTCTFNVYIFTYVHMVQVALHAFLRAKAF